MYFASSHHNLHPPLREDKHMTNYQARGIDSVMINLKIKRK